MRWVSVLFLSVFFAAGCTHQIVVMTLESTIQQVALAAQRGAGDASDKITIEVEVTNGIKGSAAAPIPVVPIGVEASLAQSTKVTIDINLKKFSLEKSLIETPKLYFLDLQNGTLTE